MIGGCKCIRGLNTGREQLFNLKDSWHTNEQGQNDHE